MIGISIVTFALVSFDKKDEQKVIAQHQEEQLTYLTSKGTAGLLKTVTITPQKKPINSIKAFPIPEPTFENGQTFEQWKEALAYKESQGRYDVVNSRGYMGKYQFGKTTLRGMGVSDSTNFLQNPQLQEEVFLKYVKYNHSELAPYIRKYSGQKIGGVLVTESGILAAAHLSGAGGVKKFLITNGGQGKKDAFGTTIRSYMTKFAGYDLSSVLK